MSVRTSSRLYPESPCGMMRNPPYPSRDRRGTPISGTRPWSSSSNEDNPNNAWNVNFNNGNVNNNNKDNNNNVRCVR